MSFIIVIFSALVIGASLALYENHKHNKMLSSFDQHSANLEALNQRLEAVLENSSCEKTEAFESRVDNSKQAVSKLFDSYKLGLSHSLQGSRLIISIDDMENQLIRANYKSRLVTARRVRQQRIVACKSRASGLETPNFLGSTKSSTGMSKSKRNEDYFSPFSGYDCLVA